VQHHHAHIAAGIAEHGVVGPVIGLALDGTGYGSDGAVWGGELLIASLTSFERFAHLAYAPMPGATAAIKEPNRMALGSLVACGIELTPKILERLGLSEKNSAVMRQMIDKRLNTPNTSSCGRLFDAVAALVLKRHTVDYEAQAAVELEGCANDDTNESGYEFDLRESADESPLLIDPAPMWREILNELERGTAVSKISERFHAGLARAWVRAAVQARKKTAVQTVALSGGCFHNRLFTKLLRRGLEAEGFTVLAHRNVSPGDGGLSYGQAAIAAALLMQERPATRPS
jgi:hydrogenase maturation protein HypF